MANEHTREGKFRRDHGGYAIGGITVAYFASPLIGNADPALSALSGICLGYTIILAYERLVLNVKTRRNIVSLIATLAFATFFILTMIVSTAHRLQSRDRHCAKLQGEMLNGRAPGTPAPPAGRSDPADAFQALGCRAS